MKIAIILLNWNGKADTLECLSALKRLTTHHHVIIVDNGSHDDSVAVISKEYPEHTLLETYANLGYAGGNNVGIDYALQNGADFVLLLNNDTSFEPNFLEPLLKLSQEHPNAGIIGPKVVRYDDRDTIDHMGGFWSDERSEYIPYAFEKKSLEVTLPLELDYISGCSILIKREVFVKIGKLDPDFFLLWEESDFCARAKKAGFEIWLAPEAILYHKVSASFEGVHLMQYYWWRNRLLWMKKNLSPEKNKELIKKVVRKEMIKFHRHALMKSLQLLFLRFFAPQKITKRRKAKQKRYVEGCKGIYDFYAKRFGKR